jgi:hypothetical protein
MKFKEANLAKRHVINYNLDHSVFNCGEILNLRCFFFNEVQQNEILLCKSCFSQ